MLTYRIILVPNMLLRPDDDSNGVFQYLINTHNGVTKWQNLN